MLEIQGLILRQTNPILTSAAGNLSTIGLIT